MPMFSRCVMIWAVAAALLAARPALAACENWTSYKGVALHRFAGSASYAWRTGRIAIDADGAPNAYHPQNKGIDDLANAGYPHGGWTSVIVPDPHDPSKGFIQPDGPFAGFFVSKTSLEDTTRPPTDPARYVDAATVPYVVFPGQFFALKGTGQKGVIGMARNLSNGKTSPMIFADTGAATHPLGEVSIRLAENLGGTNVNPKNGAGAPTGPFVYVIFPGSESRPPWPRSPEQIQQAADAGLAAIGGWDSVLACVGGN